MADGTISVAESAGKKLDTTELTVGVNTVERERVQVSGVGAAELADVKNANPAGTEYGVITRNIPSGTQPVSAASLPLPTGAAADATLTGGTAKAIARGAAKGTTAAADVTSNPVDANTQALHVDGSKVTQPISVASLPLPTGAAQDATLATLAKDATLGSIADAPGAYTIGDRLKTIASKLDTDLAIQKQILAVLQPRPVATKATATLLHRS